MTLDPLMTPVQFLKGVGPERAELLAKLEIHLVRDLLWNVPRDVLDLSAVVHPRDLQEDQPATIRGEVVDIDARPLKHGRTMVAALFRCEQEFIKGLWFNQPWMRQKLPNGSWWLISGKPKLQSRRFEFHHPRLQSLAPDDIDVKGEVLPRYHLTEGLKMHEMSRISQQAVIEYGPFVADPLPPSFLERHTLPALAEGLRQMHLPATLAEFNAGKNRLVFDDLLEFEVGVFLRRRAWDKHQTSPQIPLTPKIDQRIRRLFPFELTSGQNQAIEQIALDLNQRFPMHRLLQADVGSGKTVIAIYAMLMTLASGFQTVLMAPTEILAWQHWRTIDSMLAHSRVTRLLLTGNLTASQKNNAHTQIASGETQLIVGTQAVISQAVRYANLGLVVIDEQHKFGVMQRGQFQSEASGSNPLVPHTLVMTATPIPRSLCLTQYGDLSLSVIKEKPPGRQPVVTSRVSNPRMVGQMWDFLLRKLTEGRQLYIICPLISESQASEVAGVEGVYRDLTGAELSGWNTQMLHGRLDRDEQNEIMQRFRDGEVRVLIATTVVEVGVDIPNATLMIIRDAQRFGLSQLHQLRGRIGRGQHKGYCFLQSLVENPESQERLQILERYDDGFAVAEEDFRLRGPGDILGTRQHGELPLRVANLARDAEILEQARACAEDLVRSQVIDTPGWAIFKNQVLDRFDQLMELGRSG